MILDEKDIFIVTRLNKFKDALVLLKEKGKKIKDKFLYWNVVILKDLTVEKIFASGDFNLLYL